jgi:hypothetical protein
LAGSEKGRSSSVFIAMPRYYYYYYDGGNGSLKSQHLLGGQELFYVFTLRAIDDANVSRLIN